MSKENEIHVGCDKWIISEYMLELQWAVLSPDVRKAAAAEFVEAERDGYELPDDYAPDCVRWHIFAGEPGGDVWLGMVRGGVWIDPFKLANAWIGLMPDKAKDDGFVDALDHDGLYLVSLDGREVCRVYKFRNGDYWHV